MPAKVILDKTGAIRFLLYRILDNYYSSVYMDEDSVFTKRFVECVKKAVDERTEEVSRLNSYVGVHVEMTVG